MSNSVGRPSKYKPEYCDDIIRYFDVPPQQTTYKKTYYADGTLKSEDPVTLACQLPTLQGYAHSIDINKDTLIEWSKEHQEFSVAYTRAKELQEQIWLINGMSGLYNSQFAQFFGTNCLGYKIKQDVTLDANVTQTIKPILDD